MKLNSHGNYEPWVQPAYGKDAENNAVTTPDNCSIVPEGTALLRGDFPYDVYAGWFPDINNAYHVEREQIATSRGRWTAWARKEK